MTRRHDSDDLPGLDLPRLATWLASTMPGAVGHLIAARPLAGGRSNLTYEIQGDSGCVVLRRPPVGTVPRGAHDVEREHRVMTALADTDVPVPQPHALCTDESVIGAPFTLVERVDGTSFRGETELARLGPPRVREISMRLVDALVSLHEVDPAAVGLADFGRPDGFLERQVRLWGSLLDGSPVHDLPAAVRLRARLEASTPHAGSPAIVHGDYRLDNALIDRSDRVAAIIDWEMATIGDPLSDLALLVTYQQLARLPGGHLVADAPTAPGHLTKAEVAGRYFSRSGRDTSGFGFHLGLAALKLAAVVEGNLWPPPARPGRG